jgi:hypothetical protein
LFQSEAVDVNVGHAARQSPTIHREFVERSVEKRVVEVALVVVALRPVKFWRVVEPVARIVPEVRVPSCKCS